MEPFIFIIPIAFVVYFVIYGLMKVRIENKNRRIFNSILGAVLISPVLYFVFVAGIIFIMSREGSREFVSTEWKFGNDVDAKLNRYKMIDDLIDEEILIGKDSIKVKEIICSLDFRTNDKGSWRYNAGTGGGIGFVDHKLEISFKNNKVVNVKHIRIKD